MTSNFNSTTDVKSDVIQVPQADLDKLKRKYKIGGKRITLISNLIDFK